MTPAPSAVDLLIAEVIRLFPIFMQDPIDAQKSGGHAAVIAIAPDGRLVGHLFGEDKARSQPLFGVAHRKVTQVWRRFCAPAVWSVRAIPIARPIAPSLSGTPGMPSRWTPMIRAATSAWPGTG